MLSRHITTDRPDVAIDLGTSRTTIVDGRGQIIFDQPSLCCFDGARANSMLVAAGTTAKTYLGRVEKRLPMPRPLRNGVLGDIRAASELLRFATRGLGPAHRLRRLRTLIGVPADATQAERRALQTAAVDAGLGRPALVAEPLAAALGAQLDIDQPRGRMLVECGAGITEVAVISLGGICVLRSDRGGSEELDRALADHLRAKHRLRIGEASAENLKIALSKTYAAGGCGAVSVAGLDAASGRPIRLDVQTAELLPIWSRYVDRIVGLVRSAMRETPPELAQDVLQDGLVLTGGAARTAGLADAIALSTGTRATIAADAASCTGLGLGRALGSDRIRRGIQTPSA